MTVDTTRRLAPGEGLTVVAEIPAGAIEAPSQAQLWWWELLDNRRWIFGALGFAVVLGYYVAAWHAVGRDPKRGVVIPLFHPPEGVSPALANYIHHWGFAREKWRAFTAACLSLAVRGLIRMDNSKGALSLMETGKSPLATDNLPAGERAIVTWLNGRGGVATIDKAHGESIAKLGDSFTESIEAESRNRFFRRNLGYVLRRRRHDRAGFGLGDFLRRPQRGRNRRAVRRCLCRFCRRPGAGADRAGPVRRRRHRDLMHAVFLIVMVAIFAAIFGNFAQVLGRGLGESVRGVLSNFPFSFVFAGAFATLNGLFLYLMKAPTALGRPIMDQLAGLKLYLETAESDRLNIHAPDITADRFETLLPYAVALDVEKPWSKAFAGVCWL